MSEKITIAIGGGGTGGHVIPALAILAALRRQRDDIEVTYIGSPGSMEERLAIEHGYRFYPVRIQGIKRSLSIKNLQVPFLSLSAVLKASKILKSEGCVAAIGTGGYSSFPCIAGAWLNRIPIFLQEQNAFPGMVTRMMANKAEKVFLGYKEAENRLKVEPKRISHTGNPSVFDLKDIKASPSRRTSNKNQTPSANWEFEAVDDPPSIGKGGGSKAEARENLGLNPDNKTIFVTGGSLGALSINETVEKAINSLLDRGYNLIWQTGRTFELTLTTLKLVGNQLMIEQFLDSENMETAYQAADLAVARGGAMTLAELAHVGLPAILVPYPHHKDQHQVLNSRAVETAGGASVILNQALNAEGLIEAIDALFTGEKLERMSVAMIKMARPDAAEKIASEILGAVT